MRDLRIQVRSEGDKFLAKVLRPVGVESQREGQAYEVMAVCLADSEEKALAAVVREAFPEEEAYT